MDFLTLAAGTTVAMMVGGGAFALIESRLGGGVYQAGLDEADQFDAPTPAKRSRLRALCAVLPILALSSACRSGSSDVPRSHPTPLANTTVPAANAPRFVAAPSGPGAVEPFIQEQVELALAAGDRTLIYVGAAWCEPCQRFHAAVLEGKLDDALAGTRLLEFDAEQHTAALFRAGYTFKFIPVLAIPNPDGRSSGHLLSGSIKGPTAVTDDLLPRLRALLEGRKVD